MTTPDPERHQGMIRSHRGTARLECSCGDWVGAHLHDGEGYRQHRLDVGAPEPRDLTELAGRWKLPPEPVVDTRLEAAARLLNSTYGPGGRWDEYLDDARELLTAVDGADQAPLDLDRLDWGAARERLEANRDTTIQDMREGNVSPRAMWIQVAAGDHATAQGYRDATGRSVHDLTEVAVGRFTELTEAVLHAFDRLAAIRAREDAAVVLAGPHRAEAERILRSWTRSALPECLPEDLRRDIDWIRDRTQAIEEASGPLQPRFAPPTRTGANTSPEPRPRTAHP